MLNNWIKPNNEDQDLSQKSIAIKSNLNNSQLDTLNEFSVALLGSEGGRVQNIKESLGSMYNYFGSTKIVDLGYFQKEDPTFNIQLFNDFREGGITCLIIDKDLVWFSGILHGMKAIQPNLRNVCISNQILFTEFGIPTDFIGFQRHLVNPEHLTRVMDYSINSMSLGKLRADKDLLEPILRDVKNVFFDVSSIRKSDVPGSFDSVPSGLTCEEACQMFKYLGKNRDLQNIVIGGNFTTDENTSNCIAELIWYFLEGRSQTFNDHPAIDKKYKEYLVEVDSLNDTFSFIRNDQSGRWWFKLPEENEYISCSNQEFQMASNDELPNRLLRHYTKF
jgi:hypothetical protein